MTHTKISKRNEFRLVNGNVIILITFDMSHINNALSQKKIDPIDGIIGADILKKSKAILDYKSNKLLFEIMILWI